MAKPSCGPIIQSRVKRLLEVILDSVNSSKNPTDTFLKWEWKQDNSASPQLSVQTNLETLVELTKNDRYQGELTVEQINTSLTRYLRTFLQIIPEKNIKKRGSQDLSFTLKLWSKEKNENLQTFDEEWKQRKLEQSKPEQSLEESSEPISNLPPATGPRLPAVKTLYDILPKGTEGGKEFDRIMDLLLIHDARQKGKTFNNFNDAAGDYNGLDSFEGNTFRQEGTIGYQYKFYPSPLSSSHRSEIKKSLQTTAKRQEELKLTKWILVTSQDLTESGTRKDKGDVTWFQELRQELELNFELEHWGHSKILALFLACPMICLYYNKTRECENSYLLSRR
ncbi:MAG: hypothetical protein QNJ42_12320 [Crocosphaera sp.]|nr:hypothetical protein [Crocosphaera sp.]